MFASVSHLGLNRFKVDVSIYFPFVIICLALESGVRRVWWKDFALIFL
jgi:hypothetical protein